MCDGKSVQVLYINLKIQEEEDKATCHVALKIITAKLFDNNLLFHFYIHSMIFDVFKLNMILNHLNNRYYT